MSEKITIRQMRPNEADTVRKIGRRAFTGIESLWVPRPKLALVAEEGNRIVGAIMYKFLITGGKKTGYVDYAFVDPDYHSHGVGSELYRAAADFLWAQGCDALTAVVKDDNVGSWSLFGKNGFTRVSIPALVREFGPVGAFRHYFGTPLCFGVGMEYYVAVRNGTIPSGKDSSILQILSYLLTNAFLLLIAMLMVANNTFLLPAAYLTVLLTGILSGLIGTRLSYRRNWKFRFNNGGALICALVHLGSLFPMVGNWYPEHYEKAREFRRDMGITALTDWITLLIITVLSAFLSVTYQHSGGIHAFLRCTAQIGTYLLIYRIIPFYPFESFGGRRVLEWNKWIYAGMTLCSLALILLPSFIR